MVNLMVLNFNTKRNIFIPEFAYEHGENFQIVSAILSVLAFAGLTILAANILFSVMKSKGFICKRSLVISIISIFAIATYIRFGISIITLQGVFLSMLLIYASCSDITSHKVDDCIFVCILALSISNISRLGILTMLLGAGIVFIPQIAIALIPKINTLGGADIKIATAIAFMLGATKGMIAYLAGLLFAVIVMCIYNRVKDRSNEISFALIPFLSASTMLVYLI